MLRRKFLTVLGAIPFLAWLKPSPSPVDEPTCCDATSVCDCDCTYAEESWRYDTDPVFRRRVNDLTHKLHNRLYGKSERGDTHELNVMWQWCREHILHGAAGIIVFPDGQLSLIDDKLHEQLFNSDYVKQWPDGTKAEYLAYFTFEPSRVYGGCGYDYYRPTADDPDERHTGAMSTVASMMRVFARDNRHALPYLAAAVDRDGLEAPDNPDLIGSQPVA